MSAREELLRIHQRDGFISPRAVLEEARDEASPLHSHFTWEDGEAAERWRIYEAATLIRRYKVEIDVSDEKSVRVRAFVSTGEGQYKPTDEALRDTADRNVVLGQAQKEFRSLRRKYAALVDFDGLVQAELAAEAQGAA